MALKHFLCIGPALTINRLIEVAAAREDGMNGDLVTVSFAVTRVAESMVKYPTPTPTFPKFPTPTFQNFQLRLLNTKGMKFGFYNHWESWCTERNICFNKFFKINCTILTGVPDVGM